MRGGLPLLSDGTVGTDSQLDGGRDSGAGAGGVGRTEEHVWRDRRKRCRAFRQSGRNAKTAKARRHANPRRDSNERRADGTRRAVAEFRAGDGRATNYAGSGGPGTFAKALNAIDERDCAGNRETGGGKSAAQAGDFAECLE